MPDAVANSVPVTNDVRARFAVLRHRADTVDGAAPLARTLLRQDPGLRIMVAASYVEPLRSQMGSPDLAARIVPLPGSVR